MRPQNDPGPLLSSKREEKVRAYLLTGYRDARECADLRVCALQGPESALLWVHNVCDGHLVRIARVKPLQQEGCSVVLRGLADGVYQWQRCDTRTGQVVDRSQSHCTGGALKLGLPPSRPTPPIRSRRQDDWRRRGRLDRA
jgi:hypothetical protein